ncbi:MAG TPA: tetratricopeptide repeat protein [Bacteroidales bacterium]|nr:tetratricopeptide repeat protein [Bacteroidales bacterium]
MKRIKKFYPILFVAAMAILATSCGGNKALVSNAQRWAEEGINLDTAIKALNVAEKAEDTKDWAKTYYVKGLTYEAIANSINPEFKDLSEYPLFDAFDNYKKAYNMEGSNMYQGPIDAKMLTMANQFVNKGVDAYQNEDFEKAYKYFEKSIEVKEMPVFGGEIDTAIIFNTALTAQRVGKYDDAIKYYKQAAEYGYGEGDAYALMAETYKSKGKTDKYVSILKEGFEKYPGNQGLLGNIINYYLLEAEDTDEAFKYLKLAREGDPGNPQFYTAEAHLYDKIGESEKAKEKYKKAIELDSEFFEAYYNLGVLYFNEGVALTEEANKITDNKKYLEAKEKADDKFKESLPYIEKAQELEPGDTGIMSTLRTLYYRLKMTDKYEKISEKLEEQNQ